MMQIQRMGHDENPLRQLVRHPHSTDFHDHHQTERGLSLFVMLKAKAQRIFLGEK